MYESSSRSPWWRTIDWIMVGLVTLLLGLAISFGVGLSYEIRFHRHFAVGCAKAGGIVVTLNGTPSCVTVTPVPAQVVR